VSQPNPAAMCRLLDAKFGDFEAYPTFEIDGRATPTTALDKAAAIPRSRQPDLHRGASMTRRVLLVTALLDGIQAANGQRSTGVVYDQEVPARRVLTSEFDDSADALKAANRNNLPAKQAVHNLLTLEPPGSADETSSAVVISDAGCNELQLYPVCDCGCGIPCLDHWNVCDTPCCVTDQGVWYPYQCSHGNCYLSENDGGWVSNDTRCDVWGPPVDQSTAAVRFGWWGRAPVAE
jgi:hypothetical protein